MVVIFNLLMGIAGDAWAERKVGDTWIEPVTGMEFVWVPAGCYMMGSDDSTIMSDDEKPVHEVCVDGFWIGKYEVTQRRWKKIMGNNPSHFKGDRFPVEGVSWDDTKKFVNELNRQTEKMFSLPTEAQWEYAAKGGRGEEKYAGENDAEKVAWYIGNSDFKTHVVGTKAPNGFGIYDMSGNISEWCEDVYDRKAYEQHAKKNPVIVGGGITHVVRGGYWDHGSRFIRVTSRDNTQYNASNRRLGLRLVMP
jgi:formylglycine-generating enzyme required for sulfatase activity